MGWVLPHVSMKGKSMARKRNNKESPVEKKLISPHQAQGIALKQGIKISIPTIIKYSSDYQYGRQIGGKGGKWLIDPVKFERFLEGV